MIVKGRPRRRESPRKLVSLGPTVDSLTLPGVCNGQIINSKGGKIQAWCSEEQIAEIDEGAALDNRDRTSFVVTAALERTRILKKERAAHAADS